MHNDILAITKHLFHKDHPDQVTENEINDFLFHYPYVAPVRLLLAKKKHDAFPSETKEELITAGLYMHNALRLEGLLKDVVDQPSQSPESTPSQSFDEQIPEITPSQSLEVTPTPSQPSVSTDESPLIFQSYHTIDYFASQGIRLQHAELVKDKLGQQLKSFTEWLRSMKKLPSTETDTIQAPEDMNRQQHVIRSAAHSIEEKEVLTETMAEVWAKQGNTQKAIDIYSKLSLQNPGKSAYFAAKIDQLK